MANVTGYPVALMLDLVGDQRGDHTFFLSVEEPAPDLGMVNGVDVAQPWLRATCSCGWRDAEAQRFTIEENAHWRWRTHVERDDLRAHIGASSDPSVSTPQGQ